MNARFLPMLLLPALAARGQEPAEKPAREVPVAAATALGGAEFRHAEGASVLLWSPDGRFIATLDIRVRLWEAATGRELWSAPGNAPSFTRDGGLAWADDAGWHLADPATGKPREGAPATPSKKQDLVALSPDMSRFLARPISGRIELRSAAGEVLAETACGRPVGNYGSWLSAGFSEDGSSFFTWGSDGVLRVRDAVSLASRATLNPRDGRIESAALSPDARFAAATTSDINNRSLFLWDLTTGKRRAVLPLGGPFAFSPDSRKIAWVHAFRDQPEIVLTDLATGDPVAQHPCRAGAPSILAFRPDGAELAGVCGPVVRFWDAATGAESSRTSGHTRLVADLAFSPDGLTLASASPDGSVILWDVASRTARRTLAIPGGASALAWTPDGSGLAVAGADALRVWNPDDGTAVWKQDEGKGALPDVGFSPDGTTLVTAGPDDGRTWEAATGKALARIPESDKEPGFFANTLTAFRISPDGRRACSTQVCGFMNPGHVDYGIWDLERKTYTQLGTYTRGPAPGMAWSPDGRYLACVWDYSATLRDWAREEDVLEFTFEPETRFIYMGSWAATNYAAFFPDGSHLLIVLSDKHLRLFEMATGKLAFESGSLGDVRCVEVSPDLRTIALGLADGRILLTSLEPPSEAAERDLARAWRDLAAEDAAAAWKTGWDFARHPGAPAMLRQSLADAWRLDDLPDLLRRLESDDAGVRDAAGARLLERGGLTARESESLPPTLGPEARARLDALGPRLADPRGLPAALARQLRAVAALVRREGPDSAAALSAVRDGAPWPRLREIAGRELARRESGRGPEKK